MAQQEAQRVVNADVCVYGGTAGGVAAAVQAHRLGKRAVILEFGKHLGGLSSSGLGATDIGHRRSIGGLAREFYQRIHDYYLQTYGPGSQPVKDCFDGFRFEPHVAERLLNEMATEAGVPVLFEQRLQTVKKHGNQIIEIVTESGAVCRAKMFIDATYEGDLMAKAKLSYTVGREANVQYSETLNGVHFGDPNHNFNVSVDPYIIAGDPTSGILKGISAADPGRQGEGDHRVQTYCFRMCLTKAPDRLPFPKPAGYDPERYSLLARYINAGVWDVLRLTTPMPNGKTDTNNYGGFSTDNIGMNYDYPDGDYATRERIFQEHVTYQQGLMGFLCHDERVPPAIRVEVSQWGLPKDEFQETGGWPHQLYVREARRMVSDYVMTEHNCRGVISARDSVGLASYGMDSHHCQRVLRDGRVTNEGNVEVPISAPYPIAYRSIVPRESECRNLLVPACLSATHIAYGSIRMEPVFMILGQSAATAASMAIDGQTSVQQVDVARLQATLEEDAQILAWPEVE
ncbi:MAG: FAD-dependent oxidoreductase [Armatimonadetes bacterium]|nr:FAD-dependent oxidoreductase [Armatimonadota bacterium]